MAQKGKPFLEYVNGLPVEASPDSGDPIYLGGVTSRRTNAGLFGGGGVGGAVDSVNGFTGVVSLDADDIDDAATANKFATATQLSFLDDLVVDPTLDGLVTHDGSGTSLVRSAGGGTYLRMYSDTGNYIGFFDENSVSLGYIDVDADDGQWRFINASGDVFLRYDSATGVVTFPDGGSVDVSFDDPFSGTAPTAAAFLQLWIPSDTIDAYVWMDTGDAIVANGAWVQFGGGGGGVDVGDLGALAFEEEVTGTLMASGVALWWLDAGGSAATARPAGAAATDVVIWTNTPSEPTNLGARDLWEDAS